MTDQTPEPLTADEEFATRWAAHKSFLCLDPEAPAIGNTFLAHPSANRWALLKMAKAESTRDEEKQAVAFYDLVVTIVLPEERDRLDAYMMDNDSNDAFERMARAVGRFVKGATGIPLVPSPASSNSSSETNSGTEENSSELATKAPASLEPVWGTVPPPITPEVFAEAQRIMASATDAEKVDLVNRTVELSEFMTESRTPEEIAAFFDGKVTTRRVDLSGTTPQAD